MQFHLSHRLLLVFFVAAAIAASPAMAPAQSKKGAASIEVYKTKSGQYRFRLRNAQGKSVVKANRDYKTAAEVGKVVSQIQKIASKAAIVTDGKKATGKSASFQVYMDKGGKYRFRLKNAKGRNLASSSRSYKTNAEIMTVIRAIQTSVAKAKVVSK